MAVKFESTIRDSVIGEGGKATFVDKALFDISWRPRETSGHGEGEGLTLRAGNIHEFARLMRFLRAVEKTQLKMKEDA